MPKIEITQKSASACKQQQELVKNLKNRKQQEFVEQFRAAMAMCIGP